MDATNDVPQSDSGWDEAQCRAALAQLERLQESLSDLRLNLPHVVTPFASHTPNAPAMFQAFKRGVVSSQNAIQSFKTQWHSQEIQSIFEYATQSLNENPDLSASANIPRYGWVNTQIEEKEVARRRVNGAQQVEDTFVSLTNEEVSQHILEFQKTYPNIKVLTKDDNQDLLFQFVAGSHKLRFHVVIEREANDRHKLNAECSGMNEPFLAITRCISTRTQTNDLQYLLDMIAAYKTVQATSCAKCSKFIDSAALIPTARRSRQVASTNETSETVWEAFHEGCLE